MAQTDRRETDIGECWAIHSEAALPGSKCDDRPCQSVCRPIKAGRAATKRWVLYSTDKQQVNRQSSQTQHRGEAREEWEEEEATAAEREVEYRGRRRGHTRRRVEGEEGSFTVGVVMS